MNCPVLMHFGLPSLLCSLQYLSGKLSQASLKALLTRHWLVVLQNPIDFLSQSCLMLTSTQSAAYTVGIRIISNIRRVFIDIGSLCLRECNTPRQSCKSCHPS